MGHSSSTMSSQFDTDEGYVKIICVDNDGKPYVHPTMDVLISEKVPHEVPDPDEPKRGQGSSETQRPDGEDRR